MVGKGHECPNLLRRFAGGALLCLLAMAGADAQGTKWLGLEFLLGSWEGTGGGAPGASRGGFSFAEELQGALLVRRNRADYPATPDRAAFSHEDLMIVFREGAAPLKAVYFDNEGHTIHYTVSVAADSATFLSDSSGAGPRYRLGYVKTGPGMVRITFDIAPPGGDYTRYIEATAARKVER